MIPVKICGITSIEDAWLAADLGAAAVGLVFWPSSPRCVDVPTARSIVEALPPFVSAVGVFVQAFTLLPGWWAYAGVAATAGVVVACRPRDGESVRESVFSFLIAVLIASAVGFLLHLIAEQSEQRESQRLDHDTNLPASILIMRPHRLAIA